jgi:hypothetical protein
MPSKKSEWIGLEFTLEWPGQSVFQLLQFKLKRILVNVNIISMTLTLHLLTI